MFKRPTANETEEDLLKLQDEYLRSNQKPAVSVKRMTKRDIVDLSGQQQSDPHIEPPASFKKKDKKVVVDLKNPTQRLDEKDEVHHISSVLKKIYEKPVSNVVVENIRQYKGGFPTAPSLNKKDITIDSKSTKKKSLFAQQFARLDKKKDLGQENYEEKMNSNDGDVHVVEEDVRATSIDVDDASIVDDDTMSEKIGIHQENEEKLDNMSENEILEEQEQLLKMLDPKLLAFLKAKNAKPQQEQSKETNTKEIITENNLSEETVQNGSVNGTGVSVTKENGEGAIKGVDEKKQEDIDPYKEFHIKRDYINMNEVEKDKLEWMKSVPNVKLQKEGSVTPRFDFDGNLLPPDQNIPTHLGLHHHGDEPSLPGYSLEELFQMIRSNFLQQRSLGLKTLSKIIKKYHMGCYMDKLSCDLLQTCLNAGLIFILRWSLDEQTEQIYTNALSALANVIYLKRDQEVVEKLLYTEDGFKLPSLCTFYKKKEEEMTKEEKEEEHDLTDAELMEKDVVKAVVQMRILPRIRYLLEICQLSDNALRNSLHILQKVSQHDKESAYNVYKCPGMVRTLVGILDKGKAVDDVLRLIRTLFIAGRNMAHNFISVHPMLLEFTTARFSSFSFDGSEIAVYVQICKLWYVLLSYGLAHNLVSDLYSVILQHLQRCSTNYTAITDSCLASLVLIVRQIITVAVDKEISWNIVEGLYPLVQFNFQKVLNDVVRNEKVTHPLFLSGLMSTCVQYFKTKNCMVSVTEPVSLLSEVAKFWEDHVAGMLDSTLMDKLLLDASAHSDFQPLKSEKKNTLQDLVNLPSYGTGCFVEDGVPSLSDSSPVVLVQALVKTLLDLISINKQLILKVKKFITSVDLMAWIGCFLESEHLQRSTTLVSTRVELLTVHHCVEIYSRVITCCGRGEISDDVNSMYLQAAGRLVCLLHPGDEELVVRLMRNVIFNEKIFRIKQYVIWVSDNMPGRKKQIEEQLKLALISLQRIGSTYKANLFPTVKLSADDRKLESFLTLARGNKILPSDWMLYPMVQLYNESLNLELLGKMIAGASKDALIVIKDCLRFILLLEVMRPSLLCEVTETLRLTRLMCVFLTEGDLYTEETVRELLTSLLSIYSSTAFQSYLDFEQKIPGITSFYDLFNNLLEQYLSASYGDVVFSNLVLIPMQLAYPVKYRRAIWTEHSSILRVFPVALNKIMIDVKNFFAEEQEDIEMIRLYYRMYISARLRKQWCPLFYVIAVHHISKFIFDAKDIEDITPKNEDENEVLQERKQMLKGILELKDKDLRDDVIYYQIFNVDDSPQCLTRFNQLPPSREIMLRNVVK